MIEWLAIAAVAWGALAFGAVYPWAWWPLAALAAATGAIGLASGVRRIHRQPLPRGLLWALGTVGLAVALQLVPLPESVLRVLSPETDAFFREHSLPYAAALWAGGSPRHPLSLVPTSTARGLLLFAVFSLLLAGLAASLRPGALRRLAERLTILGVLMALIAIVQKATVVTGKVYGFWTPEQPGNPFGPFVNRNHFAGWMVMALALAIGFCCGRIARGMRGVKPGWRNRILWFSSPDANRLILTVFAALVMGLALVLSLSRSGITCFAIALVVSAWFVAGSQTSGSKRAVAGAYLAFVLLVAVGWAGLDAVAQRFQAASWNDVGVRSGAWQDALRIAGDFPLTGIGLNTFGEAMLDYQSTNLDRHFAEAHNDWLQVVAEGGVLVGVPILVALSLFVREIRRRFREARDDTLTYWLRVGAVTGLIAIALQEFVDFSLQIPGNAALFAVLSAIALHQALEPSGR